MAPRRGSASFDTLRIYLSPNFLSSAQKTLACGQFLLMVDSCLGLTILSLELDALYAFAKPSSGQAATWEYLAQALGDHPYGFRAHTGISKLLVNL